MRERTSIALACFPSTERSILLGWLTQSGYNPVSIPDLSRLHHDVQANAVEALIADVALFPEEHDVWELIRRLGSNRPLVLMGDAGRLPSSQRGDLRLIARPVTRDELLLTVGLALAEGRPARRCLRRSIEPIRASAHGMAVTVLETSAKGVGLEVAGRRPSVLPPLFQLRIPDFGVHVVVKRAWVAPVGPARMRCGGTVEGELPGATRTWSDFASSAPAPMEAVTGQFEMR